MWVIAALVVCVMSASCGNGKPAGTTAATTTSAASEPVFAGYEHDPRLNPRAMEDIVEDPAAVYGFRPSDTGSLKEYADIDWTDKQVVEDARNERIAYHNSIESMFDKLDEMSMENKSIEEIASTLSKMRNEIRLAADGDNPDALERLKARNLEKYGHEDGPQPEELYEKYGSWEIVLEKAFSVNSGMDACLGLYDDYYRLYVVTGQIEK